MTTPPPATQTPTLTKRLKSSGDAGVFIAPTPVGANHPTGWVYVLRFTNTNGEPTEIHLPNADAHHMRQDLNLIAEAGLDGINQWLDHLAHDIANHRAGQQ